MSSFQEIMGSKNCALINLSWNFIHVIMKANKIIPDNLVQSVNFEKFTSINHYWDLSQPYIWRTNTRLWFVIVVVYRGEFLKAKCNQIFRNYFVCLHNHICKILSQIIENVIMMTNHLSQIILPYELYITLSTIHSMGKLRQ